MQLTHGPDAGRDAVQHAADFDIAERLGLFFDRDGLHADGADQERQAVRNPMMGLGDQVRSGSN